MINLFEEQNAYQIVIGVGDVGIGMCDSGPSPDEKDPSYVGIAFTQLSRVYKRGEEIPESEKDNPKILISILNEGGYGALWGAVKKMGERRGYDKYNLGDKIFENLMVDLGEKGLEVLRAQHETKVANEKITALQAQIVELERQTSRLGDQLAEEQDRVEKLRNR